MTTLDEAGSGQGVQTDAELRVRADVLRRQISELEPACRAQRQKVWAVVAVGGLCFLGFGAAASQSEAFGGLAVVAFVATYFALQRVTFNSPAEEARKLRTEVERIAWQLSAAERRAAGSHFRLTPDEQREAVKAYGRSMVALAFVTGLLFAAGFLAFGIAMPYLPNTGPQDQLAFAAVALAFCAVTVVVFRLGWTQLEKRIGWRPGGIQTLRALLIGRL